MWNITEAELAKYNLKVRRDKSFVLPLCFNHEDESEVHMYPEGVQLLSEGFKSLGIPIGTEDYIEKHLQKKLEKNEGLIKGIEEIEDLQIAGLLLRYCANARINYWNRMIPPQSLAKQAFLKHHDAQILNCFQKINYISSIDESQKNQIALPLVMGGMGLLSAHQHSASAYIGSVTESVREIWERNKNQHFMPDDFQKMENFNWIQIAKENWNSLNQMLKSQDSNFEGLEPWNINELCISTTYFDFISQGDAEPPKQRMQSYLSHLINSAQLQNLLSNNNERFKTRILSAGGVGSAGFLYAIPKNPTLTMSNIQMEVAIKLRIGSDIIMENEGIAKCFCGAYIDKFGDHLLVCKQGSEKYTRHNMWLHSWERLIKKSSSPSLALEKPLYVLGITDSRNSNKRIDLIEYKSTDQSIMADVSITHPTSVQYSNNLITKPGYAADIRQKAKHSKYDESAKKLNMKFVPLIAESYGRLGSETLAFAKQKINELATIYSTSGPKIDSRIQQKLSILWWSTLSVSLQKGNVHIIMSKKTKIKSDENSGCHHFRVFDMNDIYLQRFALYGKI